MSSIQGKEEGVQQGVMRIAVRTYSWIHRQTMIASLMLLRYGEGHAMRLSLIPCYHISGRKSKKKSLILLSSYSSNWARFQFSYTNELMQQESLKMRKILSRIRILLNLLDLSLNTMVKSVIITLKIKMRGNRLINFCQFFPTFEN